MANNGEGIKILGAAFLTALIVNTASASSSIKLPYYQPKQFELTQGYGSEETCSSGDSTHCHKDLYAMDFSGAKTEVYGKPALATADGRVYKINNGDKYGGGYGYYVQVVHDRGLISMYAHLSMTEDSLYINEEIRQGQLLGQIGNTGKVYPLPTPEDLYAGTHLHFAMYEKQSDGTLAAYKPEPISGYTDLAAGNWYASDNTLYEPPAYAVAGSSGVSKPVVIGSVASGAPAAGGTAESANTANRGQSDIAASAQTGPATAGSFSCSEPCQTFVNVFASAVSGVKSFVNTAYALTLAVYGKWLALAGPKQVTVMPRSDNMASDVPPQANVQAATLLSPTPKPAVSTVNNIQADAAVADSSGDGNANPLPQNSANPNAQIAQVQVAAAVFGGAGGVGSGGGGNSPIPAGGVSVIAGSSPPPANPATLESTSTALDSSSSTAEASSTGATASSTDPATTTLPSIKNFSVAFAPETLSADFSWNAIAEATDTTSSTSYVLSDASEASSVVRLAETTGTAWSWPSTDFEKIYVFSAEAFAGGEPASLVATTTASGAEYVATFESGDSEDSQPSWYEDNWYRLGTGFYGTIYAVNLEGYVNGSTEGGRFHSHLKLLEFLDPAYATLNKTFVLSDDAPFTTTSTFVTLTGLNVPLQPNKYYRLDTYEDRQNVSVVLKGASVTDSTSSLQAGTAMWNGFEGGIGRVEHVYSFYPHLRTIMKKNFPPLSPPSVPGIPTFQFNPLNYNLGISWTSSTDPDTTDNLLSYEINVSTSTVLADNGWVPVRGLSTSTQAVFPNSYTAGVRAKDDFGNLSVPAVANWNFPAGWSVLPEQLDRSSGLPGGRQKILLASSTTIDEVRMFAVPDYGWYCCSVTYLNIYSDDGGGLGTAVATSSGANLHIGSSPTEVVYDFVAPVSLPAGSYWLVPQEISDHSNGTSFYGSASDTYPGGFWSSNGSDAGEDAYFRLRETF